MGIYDRDYSRNSESGFQLSPPTTATMQLMVVTGLVYLAQMAFPFVNRTFALQADWFLRPWTCYQLLTYGFLHSTQDVAHILINMLVLFMFGREVEARYGKREFLLFYLVGIMAAGLVWSLSEFAASSSEGLHPTVGASGALAALVVLFTLTGLTAKSCSSLSFRCQCGSQRPWAFYSTSKARCPQWRHRLRLPLGWHLYGLMYYKLGWRLSRYWPTSFAAEDPWHRSEAASPRPTGRR